MGVPEGFRIRSVCILYNTVKSDTARALLRARGLVKTLDGSWALGAALKLQGEHDIKDKDKTLR
jgi:hypothetical protein